jgi:hypothetical protein
LLAAPGAAGLSLPLARAQEIRKQVRSRGGAAVVFPVAYRTPRYDYQDAYRIALAAYEAAVAEDPTNYGPLELYDENPVYWLFSADNYWLQAEGYSPGRSAFSVDKLTGELLDDAAVKDRFLRIQEAARSA